MQRRGSDAGKSSVEKGIERLLDEYGMIRSIDGLACVISLPQSEFKERRDQTMSGVSNQ